MYLLVKDSYHVMNNIIPEECSLGHAIIEQIQDGKIYVDNTVEPKSYFIRNSSGGYYVGGDLNNTQFREQLIEYLKNKENHKTYYDLYASSSEWIHYMEKELSGNVVRLGRINFEYNEKSCTEKMQVIDLPESFRLVALDEKLYEKYVSEVDDSYAMIFSSAHDFVTNSFGFCILNQNEFVSTCNAYHVSKHTAEVDVWTDSKYRNQGYATMVVREFVKHCRMKNQLPLWNADKGNIASNHLASKCGFEKIYEEEELWWHEDKWQIEQYLKRYGYIE